MPNEDQVINSDTINSTEPSWISQSAHESPRALSQEVIDGLSQVEKQIQWIKNMMQQDFSYPEMLIHLSVVQGALNQIDQLILHNHE